MADEQKPYGDGVDPNSQHQLWSRWIFGVASGKADDAPGVPLQLIIDNARRFFRQGFKTTIGQVRCDKQGSYYTLIVEVEGPTAHDPQYRYHVKEEFEHRFMRPGFGPRATLRVFEVGILCGDQQDGKPPDQLLVMPRTPIFTTLHEP